MGNKQSENARVKLRAGKISTRAQLTADSGMTDRSVRNDIRLQRRAGVPIVPVKGGGYKIAETEAEKRELLNLYRGRALDELTTYSRLLKAMQVDGQMTVDDLLLDVVMEAAE